MPKQTIIIIAAIVLAAALGGLYFYLSQSGNLQGIFSSPPEETAGPPTRFEVPAGTKVPEKGEEVSGEVAAPQVVVPSRPGAETNFRAFKIEGRNNSFSPSEIIAYEGDIVHIDFTAQDKDYDFTIPDFGFERKASKGETKIVEFQAAGEGRYVFYCESCGGLSSSAKGYITIAPR